MRIGFVLAFCLVWCGATLGHGDQLPFGTKLQKNTQLPTSTDTSPCFCKLDGELDDCPCTAKTIDAFNSEKIHQPLMDLLKTYYFRYFQVAFNNPCTFFSDDGACASKNCGVETCSFDEVPDTVKNAKEFIENHEQPAVETENEEPMKQPVYEYIAEKLFKIYSYVEPMFISIEDLFHRLTSHRFDSNHRMKTDARVACNEAEHRRQEEPHSIHDSVDILIEDEVHKEQLNEFCQLDPLDNTGSCDFVDLTRNPERFTGYSGRSAWKIWDTIYQEICFQADAPQDKSPLPLNSETAADMCLEKRAFYKIVSGLHSSITVHLCTNYLLQEENFLRGLPAVWGQNMEEFSNRFSPKSTQNEGPERLKNAYFLYLLELRAIAKAAPVLKNIDFSEGNENDNEEIKKLLNNLLENAQNFPEHFDEEQLFKDELLDNPAMLSEFKQKFYKMSEIMDCLGCDRCKVWGKLQVTGIGAVLKILLTPLDQLKLTKHETVALVNAFGRISTSIEELKNFRN